MHKSFVSQQLQERLFLVLQFFIVHVSVPVFIWATYVISLTQRSLLGKTTAVVVELTPEEWAGGIVISSDEPLEFDDEPAEEQQPTG